MIGGPGAELFQHIVQPPIEKRRVEWMQYVGEKLIELESRGVDIGQLSENEEVWPLFNFEWVSWT